MKASSRWLRHFTTFSVWVLTLSVPLVITWAEEPGPLPCLKEAWHSFTAKDYAKSAESADRCIHNFGPLAQAQQGELTRKGARQLPTGPVDAQVKNMIFAQGVLNDVGTACWIKGRSYEFIYKKSHKQEDKERARKAYRDCIYTYARTWDRKGWFWSPCDDAAQRLKHLN